VGLSVVDQNRAGLKAQLAGMALAAAVGLGACALPASAPTSLELTAAPENSGFSYNLVPIDARVVSILNSFRVGIGPGFPRGGYVATNALHAGDVIGITVYETGGQTLFPPPAVVPGAAASSAPIGSVATGASNIPPQVVEADGTVFVPFVGRLKVSGLTPGQAGAEIERQLQGKAVGPQVMVSLVNNIGNAATVNGDVNSPRPVPLTSRGERILDVIAAAGGPKFAAYDSYVTVIRRGVVGKVLLQTIVNNPNQNIIVRPRDEIYVSHNPRTYAILGATQKVATYPFGREKTTLAEAVATGGGLVDNAADPSGIYLFRFEPLSIAKSVLPPEAIEALGPTPPEFLPILYHLNMRDAQGYFLSQAVEMRDKDVVLVTNAEATQLQKALTLVRGFTGIAADLSRNYWVVGTRR
jgi:polysaccharide export outer membrane protein